MLREIIFIWLLLLPLCWGYRNVTKRIAGGEEVGWDRYPYFALLEIKWKDQSKNRVVTDWCGSVVIATSSLLVRRHSLPRMWIWIPHSFFLIIIIIIKTAAHCLDKPNIESVTSTIGVYDLEDDPSQQVVTAQSWVLHPSFDVRKLRNDIAIVRLEKAVSVKPVSVTFENGFPKVGTKTAVFGFGRESSDKDEISDELLEINPTVSTGTLCQAIHGNENFAIATQICAGGSGKVGVFSFLSLRIALYSSNFCIDKGSVSR
jgi:secreted trypsin-like serine protease